MAEDLVTVHVAQGALRGRRVQSKGGGVLFSFKGVPYARPPVGPLRFKLPQPPEPWEGVKDALDEGPCCPQIDWLLQLPYDGDEDCLYLNVCSPKVPQGSEEVKNPVMVWIHGGGYEVGSGSTDLYGPDYLVEEGVVVVNINYRVGVFGFLSVQDESLPDNLGLKDQVAALRWVKQNIEAFGGHPNNVTIFGESAGSGSVHYHTLSPMSKGLFHRAIMQSGSAASFWGLIKEPRDFAFALGKALGCDTTDVQALISFLSTVPARDLVEAHNKMKHSKDSKKRHRQLLGPVVETGAGQSDIFLPTTAKDLMEKKHIHPVPCMIGQTSQEGIILLALDGVLENPKILNDVGENMESYIPPDFDLKRSSKETAEKIKDFYFGKNGPTEASIKEYADLGSDLWVTRGVSETVELLAKNSFSPVYYYNFAFCGELNIYKHAVKASHVAGASHMDEIGYLFTTKYFNMPEVNVETPTWTTRKRMLKLWTNFAKAGNPTPSLSSDVNILWPPYTPIDPVYLEINDTLSLGRNIFKERVDFWKTL